MATQSLEFKSDLDDTQFQAGLKNMEKGGKRVEGSLVGSFSSMAKGIGASMAAAFTVGAVVNAAKSILDFVGQLQDQADALGVNTEILQGFQGAMMGSGVSAEKFTKGMATLISSIQQAKADTGTARASFDALGISFESIANDSPDQILLKIADGLKNAKDPAAAYAAALDLVGKNQINFVAALKGGSKEFADNASKIKILSDEEVAAIDKIGLAWDTAVLKAKAYAAQALLAVANPVAPEQPTLTQKGIYSAYNPAGQYGVGMGRPSTYTPPREKPEYFGPEYTPPAPVVEDPRVKKAREAEEKSVKELRDFEAEQYRQFTSGKQSEAEKFAEDEKKRIKEIRDFEAEQYRQFTSGKQQADAKAADNQKKQAAQDAARANLEKAGQDLQQAKQNTANAAQNTTDARGSLQRALEGNADREPTSAQKQNERLMKKYEEEGKSGSIKPGVAKALKKLMEAKEAEKEAKKAEDLIKEQQKKMVLALEAINKGINGN